MDITELLQDPSARAAAARIAGGFGGGGGASLGNSGSVRTGRNRSQSDTSTLMALQLIQQQPHLRNYWDDIAAAEMTSSAMAAAAAFAGMQASSANPFAFGLHNDRSDSGRERTVSGPAATNTFAWNIPTSRPSAERIDSPPLPHQRLRGDSISFQRASPPLDPLASGITRTYGAGVLSTSPGSVTSTTSTAGGSQVHDWSSKDRPVLRRPIGMHEQQAFQEDDHIRRRWNTAEACLMTADLGGDGNSWAAAHQQIQAGKTGWHDDANYKGNHNVGGMLGDNAQQMLDLDRHYESMSAHLAKLDLAYQQQVNGARAGNDKHSIDTDQLYRQPSSYESHLPSPPSSDVSSLRSVSHSSAAAAQAAQAAAASRLSYDRRGSLSSIATTTASSSSAMLSRSSTPSAFSPAASLSPHELRHLHHAAAAAAAAANQQYAQSDDVVRVGSQPSARGYMEPVSGPGGYPRGRAGSIDSLASARAAQQQQHARVDADEQHHQAEANWAVAGMVGAAGGVKGGSVTGMSECEEPGMMDDSRFHHQMKMANTYRGGSAQQAADVMPVPSVLPVMQLRSTAQAERAELEQHRRRVAEEVLRSKNLNPPAHLIDTNPANARFFVIKSFTEDDVFKSIKYSIWSSTEIGNRRLNQAFMDTFIHKSEAARIRRGKTSVHEAYGDGNGSPPLNGSQPPPRRGPIILFFSVNSSGHFCGVAEMTSPLDWDRSSNVWAKGGKYKGVFSVKWIVVKDIPNSALRHLKVMYVRWISFQTRTDGIFTNSGNENKPVTNSRDTQELNADIGSQLYQIFATYKPKTSIIDDWDWYDQQCGDSIANNAGGTTSGADNNSRQNHYPQHSQQPSSVSSYVVTGGGGGGLSATMSPPAIPTSVMGMGGMVSGGMVSPVVGPAGVGGKPRRDGGDVACGFGTVGDSGTRAEEFVRKRTESAPLWN
ncbi:hypothetical protein HK101_003859 [Irineochytrium annulatum]|nr:hypothetical protein HK101_003859 [Irineochytrium annulatum]